SSAASPRCLPTALDASAVIPGTPLLATPAPGSLDAMPRTQLSFLGAPARALSGFDVRGSVTGRHSGRLVAYSQGDGASFIPSAPFAAGERVTVSGTWAGPPA